ncbi:MAG: nuclear transport factor 2 family protein [Novosphingobium sp.]|nr:nuclear transport factor 2 family protein [Novosphingobium sp.]MCP5401795.1 nuclear transport factor 2 family protein [Novosphingobium sp.]
MSSSAPEGLDRLLALEDIKLLRAKYCRRIDSHRFSELADILTEDFLLDMSPTGKVLGAEVQPLQGRDTIIAMMEQNFAPLKMLLHIVTIPEIEFQDGDHATGVWRQETFIKETRPDLPGSGLAYATVSDTYRKEDGRWLIASVRVELEVML